MTISVVIPSWRRPDDLARALSGLDAQSRAPDEVLVVVREDDEATPRALRAFQSPRLAPRAVCVTTPGVIAALNAGLDAAGGDIVAFTDDDSVPRPDWLEMIEGNFERDPAVGGVGGPDRLPGRPAYEPTGTVGKVSWYGRVIGEHHRGAGQPRPVDVLKGVNMAYRREAIAPARFDECLRGSGAQPHYELALGLALKRAGWKLIYDPAVVVDHYPAQRGEGDERESVSPERLRVAVHNQTYALLRWLPWWRKGVVLFYGLAVGSREAPGVLLALEAGFRRSGSSGTGKRFKAGLLGRLGAVRTAARARNDRSAGSLRI